MIEQFHFAYGLASQLARAGRLPILTLILMAGIAGCRHKPPTFLIPKNAQAPVSLEVPSAPEPPLSIATVPEPELPALSPPLPTPTPRKRPTPAPKEEAQPPAQIAEAPAELAIGTLSTGGDPTPQSQTEAQDTIASILKRIAALPAKAAEAERKQIRQVRHFLDQAQQALNSGDAQGAQNLATKARLLMDDLEKK